MQTACLEARRANGRKYEVKMYGQNKYLRLNDAQACQSVGGTGPTDLYYDEMALAVPPWSDEILILGLGCGTIARRLRELGSKAFIIGLDNDPVMLELGYKHFFLDEFVNMVCLGDARTFHEKCPFTFDAVLIDCFRDNFQQIHLPNAHNLVAPGGRLIINNLKEGISIENF